MKLLSTQQIEWNANPNPSFDLMLAASGYESRAIHVSSRLDLGRVKQRIAFCIEDRPVLAREKNDRFFSAHDFHLTHSSGSDGEAIKNSICQLLRVSRQRHIRILVDITSMTRVWYGSVLRAIREIECECEHVDVLFAYAPSVFSIPQDPAPNAHMGPVTGFSRLKLPDRKNALILGLGYERDRGLGLAEYVEAAETFAFYANPSTDPRFVRYVLENNAQLIRDLGPNRVFTYPFMDYQAAAARVSSLAFGLFSQEFRIILAPLGPKPFVLLCFLLSTRFPDMDVWRVSAGEGGATYDRAPLGPILACRARFVPMSSAAAAGYSVFEDLEVYRF
jgi:hypothetical protein